MTPPEAPNTSANPGRPTLAGHIAILRIDHWFKNVFVLPGLVVALTIPGDHDSAAIAVDLILGLLAICLVCSSNYVINELLDAPFDRHHPSKRNRPVPSGLVSTPLAYLQWIALFGAGLAIASFVSQPFALTMAALWMMGCIYNTPPIRSKDRAYIDVLSEAVNNPIRMLAGWFIVGPDAVTPASLLLSYWMGGCYLMAIKRLAEYRFIGERDIAITYRRSFGRYTVNRLLTSIMFYSAAAMLFFGVFVMRYRLELVLCFPLIALAMAVYLNVGLRPNSPAQHPESLYREPGLMATCAACALALMLCLWIDMPWLAELVAPLAPTR